VCEVILSSKLTEIKENTHRHKLVTKFSQYVYGDCCCGRHYEKYSVK